MNKTPQIILITNSKTSILINCLIRSMLNRAQKGKTKETPMLKKIREILEFSNMKQSSVDLSP